MSNHRKKWIYWIACALVLAGAAAVIILSLPKEEVIPAAKFDGSVRLSELSEDDCIEFIKSRKISIPNDLAGANVGKFIKDSIVQFETDPFSPAAYDYTVTWQFFEDIRRAVNEYYGVPTLKNGTYEFDKCLYMTPISSFYPFEGTGEKYTVSTNYFLIANPKNMNASQKFFKTFWTVVPVDLNTWDERFQFVNPLDISGYTYRACYPVSERYQLLLMDNEVWLASISPESDVFWSIYKLKLSE